MNSRFILVPLFAVSSFALGVSVPTRISTVGRENRAEAALQDASLVRTGFAEEDITPRLGDKPVFMAGFGQNRKASGVHDPLKARALVLQHNKQKIALVSIDLVGLSYPVVLSVRKKLTDFTYVLVSSTHNHEGPDTIGLWGPSPFISGVDPDYMELVEKQIVKAVKAAARSMRLLPAKVGSASDPNLLHDGREPYIKHDELVTVQFLNKDTGKPAGLLVQWNCHPETLADRNTQLSADFVGATVNYLQKKYECPVVYLTGTVGGLMTSLHVEVKNDKGQALADGTIEKTERYGQLIGRLADKAIQAGRPAQLTPLIARSRQVFVPMDNPHYLIGRRIGVLKREAFFWEGDPNKATPTHGKDGAKRLCIQTEVGWLRFGDVDIALIPGEIYPELVLSKVQDPPDPGADFPDAPIEPGIYHQLRGPYRMIVGLANDEIGYIIPRRQWDEKPPFCYGRKKAQYGETNSVGPETAPILCKAFKELVEH